jgi:hypothetical protein
MTKVYPSVRYHRTEAPLTVQSAEDEEARAHPDNGWAMTPADFEADETPAPEDKPRKARKR